MRVYTQFIRTSTMIYSRFSDIPNDCLEDIFKYLDLKERVRYERVHSRWLDLLYVFWARQQTICIATKGKLVKHHAYYILENIRTCSDTSHHARECDIIKIKTRKKNRICYEILRRCTNLKSLTFAGNVPSNIKSYLAECCPRLEHIQSILEKRERIPKHRGWFQDFDISHNLKCILISDLTGCESFLEACENLKSLHTNLIESEVLDYMTKHQPLKCISVKPQSIEFERSGEYAELKKLVTDNGPNLHTLSLGFVDSYAHMRAWSPLANLVRLEFASEPNRLYHLRELRNLKELKWRSKATFSCDLYLFDLLDIIGHQLKKLVLSHARASWIELHRCVNLEHLEVIEHNEWDFAIRDIHHLPKMPKLRTFILQYYFGYFDHEFYNYFYEYASLINCNYTEFLLHQMPSLRTVMFHDMNKETVRRLAKFATQNPKRNITVYNHYFERKEYKKIKWSTNLRILACKPLKPFM